jgi:hypothetical protein
MLNRSHHVKVVAWSFLIAVGAAYSAGTEPRPEFPKARITYKTAGPVDSEQLVVSWTDGGKKFRGDRTGELGVPIAWYLGDGAYYYIHQRKMGKRVLRAKLPARPRGAAIPVLPQLPNGKRVGNGEALGRPCEIREANDQRLWLWKGIPLKHEVRSNGGWVPALVAFRVESAPKFAPDFFRLPAGYAVKDLSGVRR